jgi:hypothetical protein
VADDGTLHLHNIQKSSEGYYLCEATNDIGAGLSAVTFINVQAPPQFEIKYRNQTARRGESAVLACEAKGEKPIGVMWNFNDKRIDPKTTPRYTVRSEVTDFGGRSDLSIKKTDRTDSGLFTCRATNAFGSDDTSINLIVQERPEVPYNIKVTDKDGRSVKLSWNAPYDGNSPLTRYGIEYRTSKRTWEDVNERVEIPGDQVRAGVFNLRPATTYFLRIFAENEVGLSDASDVVTIITAEEAPSAPPQNVKIESGDEHTLQVTWQPPPREEWNGDIQGYYIGYKLTDSQDPYLFETVEYSQERNHEHHLQLSNLK